VTDPSVDPTRDPTSDPTPPDVPAGEPTAAPSPEGTTGAATDGFGDAGAEVGDESFDTAPAPGAAAGPAGAAADAPVSDADVARAEVPVDEQGDTEVDELAAMKGSLADLTNDLQRLSAEYANYRKRVDRDRQLVADNAAYKALAPVIEVLDTIDRAREHGELDGGFKAVADQLERAVGASGLVRFGEPGDAFDPTMHEALSHLGTDGHVTVTTVKHVAKGGYRIGDRVVRAAQVLVVDPDDTTA
jgi:molecular chaperone GrpE